MYRVTLVTAVALLMLGCRSLTSSSLSVPHGVWGGDHVALVVTSEGAQVNFDCGHGTVDEALTLDSQEQFDVKGSFTPEGGPTPASEQSRPARYSGRLQGTSMTLSVTLTDTSQMVGSFALALGRPPSLVKCQ